MCSLMMILTTKARGKGGNQSRSHVKWEVRLHVQVHVHVARKRRKETIASLRPSVCTICVSTAAPSPPHTRTETHTESPIDRQSLIPTTTLFAAMSMSWLRRQVPSCWALRPSGVTLNPPQCHLDESQSTVKPHPLRLELSGCCL